MAGFSTHISTSTVVGLGYAAVGHLKFDVPLPVALVSGGLCSIAGILPDLDSDSGKPVREIMAFAAAVIPLLMMDRLAQLGLSHESMVLAGGCAYIVIRFGLGEILNRYTVHRGMWHSIPAAIIAGLVAALLCSGTVFEYRIYKVGAVVLGYMTHLVLDELWAIDLARGRIKNSFGSALKFWSKSRWANVSTYGKLLLFAVLAAGDPVYSERFGRDEGKAYRVAREAVEQVLGPPRADKVRR